MQVAANYLLSLINDVLQMSKIEDGNVPLTKDIIDIIEQRAKERGIKMQFNAKNDIRYPFVYGSPVHLRQIFLNIYGNCIKYNHIGGSIITTSDYTETDDGVVMYEWTITDTGIGMSKEYKKHIFEPFFTGTSVYRKRSSWYWAWNVHCKRTDRKNGWKH